MSSQRISPRALYPHFRNKQELFRHVLEGVQREVADQVEQEAAKGADVWEQLFMGCRAFVMAAVTEHNKRIMLIDGPSVLGREAWTSGTRCACCAVSWNLCSRSVRSRPVQWRR
ncbi:TetR/AcrR family transcriptional regulator [Xylanibacillus composti]|nr:TetR/AcrR family transcriptional regulator [Xylanibacillus composti]